MFFNGLWGSCLMIYRGNFFLFLLLLIPVLVIAQPAITGLNPSSGSTGSTVLISGSGFSTVPANNIVWFGSSRASVTTASASLLTVTAPTGFSPQPVAVTTNNLTAYSPVPFIVTFPGGDGPFTIGSFAPKVDVTATGSPYDIASADLDDDNKPELVTANFSSGTVSVFKNACTPTTIDFSIRTDFPANSLSVSIAIGDIDGDGLPDLVIGNTGSPSLISILRNTSAGGIISFAPKLDYPVTATPYNIAIGEIDGDGKPEIIAVSGSNILVFPNLSSPGSVSLGSGLSIPAGLSTSGLAIVDINTNGKADIITCNQSSSTISVLNNVSSPGTISFDAPLPYTTGSGPVAVAVGNLDNDDKPDIAVANYNSSSISVLKNTGAGNSISFGPKQDLALFNQPWDIEIADMNGDGKQDISCSNFESSKSVSIFRNISAGSAISFEVKVEYATAEKNKGLVITDLTGDGRPDIATSPNSTTYKLSVLRNKIGDAPVISSFTPVTAGQTSVITIKGLNLAGVNAISFGNVAATAFNIITDTSITGTVGTGASGSVSIISPAGSAALPGFIYTGPPSITSFTPISGPVGQSVKITGTNFSTTPTGNTVYFGGAKATINSASANALYVTVPSGATYQPISVTKDNYTVYSKQPFNITFMNGNISSSSFIKKIDQFTTANNGLQHIAVADIDADGKTDVIVNNYGLNSFSVYRNTTLNGVISFAARVSFTTSGNHPLHISTADFDGDGKLDIAVPCEWSSAVNVFRNTSVPGTISFAVPKLYNPGSYPDHIAIGDLDGDGKLDLAVANNSSAYISVFRNTSTPSDISFTPHQTFPTRSFNTACTFIGDVDGDSKPDIVSTNFDDSIFSIFKNTSSAGAISMASRIDYFAGHRNTFVTMGDLDGDGKHDMILSTGTYCQLGAGLADSLILVFRNLSTPGSISFAPRSVFITTPYPWMVALSDADGDGKPDMISANGESYVTVLKNTSTTGNLSFATGIKYLSSFTNPEGIACGDLDGDGNPDIAAANSSTETMSVFINQNGSDVSVCPNGNISIYSNLTGATYQWQVNTGSGYTNVINNSNYSGAATSTLQLSNIPSSWRGYSYTCIVTGVSSKVFTIKFTNQWTGAVNSSWENPGNWSCGTVPDSNTDVVISSGAIVLNSNVTVWSLKIDPDVAFTVNTGYTLTVLH